MSGIDEFKTRLQRMKELPKLMVNEVNLQVAYNMASEIRNRVQERGLSPTGKKFKPYSTKPSLVGGKSFRTKTTADNFFNRKNLKWVTKNGHHLAVIPGGYKEIREVSGLQTAHKDFLFTGDLFLDFNVLTKAHLEGNKIVFTLGVKSSKNQKKVEGNSKREGLTGDFNILSASKTERRLAVKQMTQIMLRFMKELNFKVA